VLKGATARRYAQAVFEISQEAGRVDRWRDDVRMIAEYLGNRRLLFVLSEPKIPFERKELILRDLLADKVQPEALNFAFLLVERGLAELAPRISQEFERLYNDYRGQAEAQVTTAVPLDDDLRRQIAGQLQTLTGKRILLQERVDPAILGGAIARVGDTLIDGSLRRRFQLLRQQIAAGAFGGPEDGGSPAALVGTDSGPRDGSASGGTPEAAVPPVDSSAAPQPPTGSANGGSGPNGPSRATETAPRQSDAPRRQPRTQVGSADSGRIGNAGRSAGGRQSGKNGSPNPSNKRRRR
jgi:F-type H+-transporting ATPase subunit delta